MKQVLHEVVHFSRKLAADVEHSTINQLLVAGANPLGGPLRPRLPIGRDHSRSITGSETRNVDRCLALAVHGQEILEDRVADPGAYVLRVGRNVARIVAEAPGAKG